MPRRLTGTALMLLGAACWAGAARRDIHWLEFAGLALLGLGWLVELVVQPRARHRHWAGLLLVLAAAVAFGMGFAAARHAWLLEGTIAFLAGLILALSMTNVPHLMRREMAAYFYSPIAYVTAAVFLVGSGIVFIMVLSGLRDASARGIQPFIEVMGAVLPFVSAVMMFVCPMITMRLLSEERSTGTIEVLMTAPVTDFEVVISKFFAGLLFYAYLLAITLVYVVIAWRVSHPDYGPIIASYLALILTGCVFLSIGLLVSSFTRNQIVAAVVTFVLLLLFFMVDMASGRASGSIQDVLNYISLGELYGTFQKGIVDTRYLVFSLTFTAAMLFFTVRSLESRKWR